MTADSNNISKLDDQVKIDWTKAEANTEGKLWMAASLIFKPTSLNQYTERYLKDAQRGDMVGLVCARGLNDAETDLAYAT